MANSIDVKIPDIGDYHDVPVIEVLVRDGDAVEKDAPLLVLESDKATLEVPAPASGVVRNFKLKANDKVSQGDLICQLEVTGGSAPAKSVAPTKPADTAKKPLPAVSPPHSGGEAALSAGEGKGSAEAKPLAPAPLPKGEGKAGVSRLPVKIPDIGDYRDVPVIEVLVKDGDAVEKDTPLLVLESDKATLEVPAPAAGVVRGFKLKANDKVSQGDLVCELELTGVQAAASMAPPPAAPSSGPSPAPTIRTVAIMVDAAPLPVPPPVERASDTVYAGPATRKV
ncbi:MAG: biotin/lipoyl-containing protein, partial [Stenotrophobium sp.]